MALASFTVRLESGSKAQGFDRTLAASRCARLGVVGLLVKYDISGMSVFPLVGY